MERPRSGVTPGQGNVERPGRAGAAVPGPLPPPGGSTAPRRHPRPAPRRAPGAEGRSVLARGPGTNRSPVSRDLRPLPSREVSPPQPRPTAAMDAGHRPGAVLAVAQWQKAEKEVWAVPLPGSIKDGMISPPMYRTWTTALRGVLDATVCRQPFVLSSNTGCCS